MSSSEQNRFTWRKAAWFTLRQTLIAALFALVLGYVNGGGWKTYWLFFRAALVFAFSIGLALVINLRVLLPRYLKGDPAVTGKGLVVEIVSSALASLLGGFVAGLVLDATLMPGILGSRHAYAAFFFYNGLFTALFMGVIYAYLFHRSYVEQVRAEEQIKAQLAQAELRALRAQINPHFLFNTLNSIAALIAQDPGRAEALTERLAEIFRYSLRGSELENVTLGDELDFIRSYLDIERARFGRRLQVAEQVEAGTESCEVPALILQPLVENAVRHGVAARPEGGRVRVSAALRDGHLVLEVEDDGPGFREDDAADGFGLHSVRERMRVLGQGHRLEIESGPGRGTLARVRLPVIEH